jgi:hypothetical protein
MKMLPFPPIEEEKENYVHLHNIHLILQFCILYMNRKEQEYQKQLRDQIAEKKRKKDEEKRGEVKLKQKEMQEYLRGHYKGDIPEHLISALEGNGNDDSDADNDRERGRGSPSRETSRHSKGGVKGRNGDSIGNHREEDRSNCDKRRGRQDRDGDRDRDNQMGQSAGRRVERGRDTNRDRDSPRRKGDDRSEHDDEGQWRDRDQGQGSSGNDSSDSRSSRRGRDKDKGKKFQDKEGRWVSEAEYGELTSLCDRLMSQQDRLQEEIQHQAEMIKVTATLG